MSASIDLMKQQQTDCWLSNVSRCHLHLHFHRYRNLINKSHFRNNNRHVHIVTCISSVCWNVLLILSTTTTIAETAFALSFGSSPNYHNRVNSNSNNSFFNHQSRKRSTFTTCTMALFPTTPTRSSKTTTTAILMSPDNQLTPTCGTNNSCLRRSSRIGKSDNEKIHRKGGVRLFQAQAQERELRSIGNATLPKKRGSSNTTSRSSSTGPGTTRSTAKRSRRARVTTSSTVATATAVAAPSTPNNNNRGTTCTDAVVRPVPVTPELLRGNGTNDDDDDDDGESF
mmetsp:Transcript_54850/g.63311  ORF Transcript_54850/g.63311 Transcript_54850/m.63311 type:complete len:284 (-) Transcript_54850:379-1230(-)